jgi:hypothetical protein
MIENICEKIDWFFSFMADTVLNMLSASCKKVSMAEAGKFVPELQEVSGSKFDLSTSFEQKIDVCLLLISSTSFIMILREEKL